VEKFEDFAQLGRFTLRDEGIRLPPTLKQMLSFG
jgi:hypothetical protein